ncbi:MAG: hypothetical protein HQK89_08190 [Nitrospirae bacterium]|nr:hypothetical protein [Nitrospirota bacterium]
MATILDTLKLSEDLKASGFTDNHARGITEAIKETHKVKIEGLATKEDPGQDGNDVLKKYLTSNSAVFK